MVENGISNDGRPLLAIGHNDVLLWLLLIVWFMPLWMPNKVKTYWQIQINLNDLLGNTITYISGLQSKWVSAMHCNELQSYLQCTKYVMDCSTYKDFFFERGEIGAIGSKKKPGAMSAAFQLFHQNRFSETGRTPTNTYNIHIKYVGSAERCLKVIIKSYYW